MKFFPICFFSPHFLRAIINTRALVWLMRNFRYLRTIFHYRNPFVSQTKTASRTMHTHAPKHIYTYVISPPARQYTISRVQRGVVEDNSGSHRPYRRVCVCDVRCVRVRRGWWGDELAFSGARNRASVQAEIVSLPATSAPFPSRVFVESERRGRRKCVCVCIHTRRWGARARGAVLHTYIVGRERSNFSGAEGGAEERGQDAVFKSTEEHR